MSFILSCSVPVKVRTTPAILSDRLGPASPNQRVRLISSSLMMTFASAILAGCALWVTGTRGKESPELVLGGVKADKGRRGRDFGFLQRGLLMMRKMPDMEIYLNKILLLLIHRLGPFLRPFVPLCLGQPRDGEEGISLAASFVSSICSARNLSNAASALSRSSRFPSALPSRIPSFRPRLNPSLYPSRFPSS